MLTVRESFSISLQHFLYITINRQLTSGYFKGTVKRDFRPQVFFLHHLNQPGPLDQWVKIFTILLSYSNFYDSLPGIIPPGINLPGVSYCAEYHTLASHLSKFVLKSPRGLIPRRVRLPGVSYLLSQSPRGVRPLQVTHDPGASTAISYKFCTGL